MIGKKILFPIVSSIIILSASVPVLADVYKDDVINTYSTENSDKPSIRTTTYEVIGNNVRFRETPSLSGNVIGYLNKGDLVTGGSYEGWEVEADGYTWVHCFSYKYELNGWVSKDYLIEY